MDVARRERDGSRPGAGGMTLWFTVPVGNRVRGVVGWLAWRVPGGRRHVRRVVVAGWHFDRLGNLDHYRRVHHLGGRAVAHLRSVAGVWEIRRDRVVVGNGNIRDGGTCFVVGAVARNLIMTVWAGTGDGAISRSVAGCTGRLGAAVRRPWADNFVRGAGQCHGDGGIRNRQITRVVG